MFHCIIFLRGKLGCDYSIYIQLHSGRDQEMLQNESCEKCIDQNQCDYFERRVFKTGPTQHPFTPCSADCSRWPILLLYLKFLLSLVIWIN